jgi:hypothetical protein
MTGKNFSFAQGYSFSASLMGISPGLEDKPLDIQGGKCFARS